MKSIRFCLMAIVVCLSVVLTGCPDYSHLREVPDYQNMTDSGVEPEDTELETKE